MNSQLVLMAERMGIKIYRAPMFMYPISGMYDTATDSITINDAPILFTPDVCLAHELVHATGSHKRLNRGLIATYTRFCETNKIQPIPPDLMDSRGMAVEEIIAQYGAMLLINQLGIYVPHLEQDTNKYLRSFGAIDGMPNADQERQANEAVEYLLKQLEQRVAA